MKLNFGGNQGVRQRQATFELGPLYCSGKAERDLHGSGYLNSSPTSCRDLLLKGITQVRSVCEILYNYLKRSFMKKYIKSYTYSCFTF